MTFTMSSMEYNTGDIISNDPAGYSSGGTFTVPTTGDTWTVDFVEPVDLKPLAELVGKCVACGDEAEVLLCAECGVAVRELGRSKLRKTMEAIEEELG